MSNPAGEVKKSYLTGASRLETLIGNRQGISGVIAWEAMVLSTGSL